MNQPRVMTPRQRLLAFLRNEPTDRVPIWLLFPYDTTDYYVDVRNSPVYRPVFEASRDRAVMLNRRNLHAPLFSPDVRCSEEVIHEHGQPIRRRRWRFGGDELYTEHYLIDGRAAPRKPMLTSADELRLFTSFPIERDRKRIFAALDAQMPRYERERGAFPIEYGAMMLDLGEPVVELYHNSNLEEYAVWSLTDAPLVERALDLLMERARVIYEYTLSRALAEVYFLVGSELASPPMVSRATFLRWVVPYAKELIEMIHDAGAYVIQHYHGQIRQVLADFITMGADALHTIEEPPVGDCPLPEAFDIVGDRLGLIGCIQYDCFRSYTPRQMREAVYEQVATLRGKRFMLSPSAGPYEEQPQPQVIDNYLAFLDASWHAGAK